MAIIQVHTNPGSRIAAGNDLLARAGKVSAKAVTTKLAAFKKIHAGYVAAEKAATAASDAEATALQAIATADVTQDVELDKLASALIGAGGKRTNPFAAMGFEAPSLIAKMGYGDEAKRVKQLVAALDSKAPAAVKAAGKNALAASAAVTKAIALAVAPKAARVAALSGRHALDQGWETAYASVKNAARVAEDDGAKGIFNALFGGPKPRPKKKAAKAPAAAAVTPTAAAVTPSIT
jgi:hypothetical protein